MIRALFYLEAVTMWNRVTRQFGRLKKPKYLAAALAGAAYVWFLFLSPAFGSTPHGRGSVAKLPTCAGTLDAIEMVGAFGMLLFAISCWMLPRNRAALDFTEAEVAFLFPAPFTRRTLIHFKLLKSQWRVLLSAAVMTVFTGRFATGGQVVWHLVGWWVAMSMLGLHVLGSSFAISLLVERGVSHWRRRLTVLGIAGLCIGGTALWAWLSLPPLDEATRENPRALADYAVQAASCGPLPWLLLPFKWLAKPMLAPDAGAFLLALPAALLVLGLHYWWVISMDVSFEEASIEQARRRARALDAVRSGNLHAAMHGHRARRPPFPLSSSGPRLVGLLWKNLIGAGSFVRVAIAVVFLAGLGVLATVLPQGGKPGMVLRLLGAIVVGISPMILLMGPHMVTCDLRQDLTSAEALKTYPLRGWQIALGEMLAPAVVLCVIQWGLIIAGVFLSASFFHRSPPPLATRMAFGLGAAILAPALNMVSLVLLNGAALLFPAWARLGRGGEGIELVGQQLLAAVAHALALALTAIPPAACFAAVYFAGRSWLSLPLLVPAGAFMASLAFLAEAGFGLFMLGDLFERLDISDELTR